MTVLNPGQFDAVNTMSGPLLVLAGAGTGKTRVITFRIAKLIKSGVPAERILGVTFTNKAATEMQERLEMMLGRGNSTKPFISTFHSLCVRILRRHIEALGYPERFSIYNRGDQEAVARSVLREINVADTLLAPSQLLYIIGDWKNRSLSPEKAALECDTDRDHLAAIAYRRYQKNLKNSGAVDFDDLLLLTEKLFKKEPRIRLQEAAMFDHLLVDEYQDTNYSQYQIVAALAGGHRNLCVVGDDDQSIYGWRGAEVEHILRFHHDWQDAKVVRLEENYRCTGAILGLANSLISFNQTRHEKVLRPARGTGERPKIQQYPNEEKEASETVYSIRRRLEQPGAQPKDFAILFRTNEQPRPFETELRKAKLPYVLVGGMSFFDRKEVKDILAYMKVAEGAADEVSVLRILNSPPRGIGKKTIEQLLDHSIKNKLDLWSVVQGRSSRPSFPANAIRGMERLTQVIAETKKRTGSMVDRTRALIQAIDYRAEVDRLYPDNNERESRWNVVEQIVNALGEYEASARKPTFTEFLDRILLGDQDPQEEKEKQLTKNAIMLMTMHSAKGLEFPEVYIVGLEEGILPHHRSLEGDQKGVEEERRLCYVGITRAQEKLTLSMSLTRRKWGKSRDTIPSRFLYELTGQADHPNYAKG
ncbi:MAG: UvrD-helicase domain-containing protein [Mariniblastus sp.]|nr:UvrD-helicase domain-containing protein [Mariniblastus sp.]